MIRINIKEEDVSSNIVQTSSDHIVFVPGFAVGGTAEVGIPYLCTSAALFTSLFGIQPPKFPSVVPSEGEVPTPQYYPLYVSTGTPHAGFEDDAYGGVANTVMFEAGSNDPSYIYAKELINAGMKVVYVRMNETTDSESEDYDVTVERAYGYMSTNVFNTSTSPILSKGTYNIEFITSGGYPTFEHSSNIALSMATIAATRGDCKALIDHTAYKARPLTGVTSVFNKVQTESLTTLTDTFASMFTPACVCKMGDTSYGEVSRVMPASFVYLLAYSTILDRNPWASVSGTNRGYAPFVQSLWTTETLTLEIAESWIKDLGNTSSEIQENISINPIVNIYNYGFCIWGNRTLRAASLNRDGYCLNFDNVRNIVCDVKKLAYQTALKYMFEVNGDITFANFKADVENTLERMRTSNALYGYKVLKLASSDKSTLNVNIRISPTSAIEKFDITVSITNDETEVAE